MTFRYDCLDLTADIRDKETRLFLCLHGPRLMSSRLEFVGVCLSTNHGGLDEILMICRRKASVCELGVDIQPQPSFVCPGVQLSAQIKLKLIITCRCHFPLTYEVISVNYKLY